MSEDIFNIYVERLRKGHEEKIEGAVSPEIMDVHESELLFQAPVKIKGTASRADNAVVVHLAVETEALMPCIVCNNQTPVKIILDNVYLIVELDEVKAGIYNFKNELREQILLQLPSVVECHNGACPERESMAQFLSKKPVDSYHPFGEL